MARHRLPHWRKATCHPTRWAVRGELCRDCLPRDPVMLLEHGPAPSECPHCHNKPPGWLADDLSGRCVNCGQRWERRIQAAFTL